MNKTPVTYIPLFLVIFMAVANLNDMNKVLQNIRMQFITAIHSYFDVYAAYTYHTHYKQ